MMDNLVYLWLVFLGVGVNRWVFPTLDVLFELITYWLASFSNRIVIKTQREQHLFKKETEEDEIGTQLIGYDIASVPVDVDDDGFDEEFEDDEDGDRDCRMKHRNRNRVRKAGFKYKNNVK